MGQKAAPAFNHPEKIPFSLNRGDEKTHGRHDLEEICAVAHLSDAIEGLRKLRAK